MFHPGRNVRIFPYVYFAAGLLSYWNSAITAIGTPSASSTTAAAPAGRHPIGEFHHGGSAGRTTTGRVEPRHAERRGARPAGTAEFLCTIDIAFGSGHYSQTSLRQPHQQVTGNRTTNAAEFQGS